METLQKLSSPTGGHLAKLQISTQLRISLKIVHIQNHLRASTRKRRNYPPLIDESSAAAVAPISAQADEPGSGVRLANFILIRGKSSCSTQKITPNKTARDIWNQSDAWWFTCYSQEECKKKQLHAETLTVWCWKSLFLSDLWLPPVILPASFPAQL